MTYHLFLLFSSQTYMRRLVSSYESSLAWMRIFQGKGPTFFKVLKMGKMNVNLNCTILKLFLQLNNFSLHWKINLFFNKQVQIQVTLWKNIVTNFPLFFLENIYFWLIHKLKFLVISKRKFQVTHSEPSCWTHSRVPLWSISSSLEILKLNRSGGFRPAGIVICCNRKRNKKLIKL